LAGSRKADHPVSDSASAVLPVHGLYSPENYGRIGAGADAAAINAAVAAARAAGGGVVVLSQPYAIESTISVTTGPAVHFWCLGAGNRQVNPDTLTGGHVRPANGFPANTPLFSIGRASQPAGNPCGTTFWMPRACGRSPDGTAIGGCTGIRITDTADVHLVEPFLADFDRSGASGTAVWLTAATAGHGVGFCVTGGVISSSWRGIYGDGAGVTDLRLSGLLEHSNTLGITLGPTAGGGGLQMSNCHLVYASAPAGACRLSLGPSAGDFVITGNYFDKNGQSPAVALATARGKFTDNHFLADALCNGPIVTVATASQSLTFRGNDCRANNSSMTALLQLLKGAGGAPANGVYDGNNVYGTHPALIAPLIDKNAAAIPPTSTATTYVAGNVAGP
jgi:hypothetical protein